MRTLRPSRPVLAALLLPLVTAAVAAGLPVEVSLKSPLAVMDGAHLVFAFELQARNVGPATLQVRSVDYVVSVQGTRFFSGTAQGLSLAPGSARPVQVAGFSAGPAEAQVLARLRNTQRYTYRVTGTLHAVAPSGAPLELAFVASGEGVTPDDVAAQDGKARTGPGRYSLLNY